MRERLIISSKISKEIGVFPKLRHLVPFTTLLRRLHRVFHNARSRARAGCTIRKLAHAQIAILAKFYSMT